MKPANSLTILGKIGGRVFQRVRPGLGNVPGDPTRSLQNRALVSPSTPPTPAQLARRAKFAQAIATWHALPPEKKLDYHRRGSKRALPGFNLFLSETMKEV